MTTLSTPPASRHAGGPGDAPRPPAAGGIPTLIATAAAILMLALPAQAGTVLRHQSCPSPALNRPLTYGLYRPDTPGRLPTLYLLHGVDGDEAEWIDLGGIGPLADAMIAAGRMPPVLIAMPDAGNTWYVDSRVLGGPGDMATAIARDLPACLAQAGLAATTPHSRAIAGISMGGFGGLRIALADPRDYAAAVSLSGAFWIGMNRTTPLHHDMARIFNGAFGTPFDPDRFVAESPLALLDHPAPADAPAFFLTAGDSDGFGTGKEIPPLAARLRAEGYSVETDSGPGGHDWGFWKSALPRMLSFTGRYLARAPGPLTSSRETPSLPARTGLAPGRADGGGG